MNDIDAGEHRPQIRAQEQATKTLTAKRSRYGRERPIHVTTYTDSCVRRIALSCRRRGCFVIRPTSARRGDRWIRIRNPER